MQQGNRSLLLNVRSIYRAYGEGLHGATVVFGDTVIYQIHQITLETYKLIYHEGHSGVYVQASLMLIVFIKEDE